MKILDTNLWVFGTLRTDERATTLLDSIDRGETVSAINAYMVQEALSAFELDSRVIYLALHQEEGRQGRTETSLMMQVLFNAGEDDRQSGRLRNR